MAGPNLELFKFGVYVFFPVAMMFHFGNPDWYDKHIVPYREKFWPPEEKTNNPPHDRAAIEVEIARFKAERHARRQQQQLLQSTQSPTPAETPRLV